MCWWGKKKKRITIFYLGRKSKRINKGSFISIGNINRAHPRSLSIPWNHPQALNPWFWKRSSNNARTKCFPLLFNEHQPGIRITRTTKQKEIKKKKKAEGVLAPSFTSPTSTPTPTSTQHIPTVWARIKLTQLFQAHS